jgi:pimeloyl-ACP methyl ester carboxylesterase
MNYSTDFFERDGVRMYYMKAGSGKPLLFLPGVLFPAKIYNQVLFELSKHYLIIAPDLPCFGNSSIPKQPWDYTNYANFLNYFIDSLKLDNLIIVGHSFGGGIAISLAINNKHISKLILLDPGISLNKLSSLQLCYRAFRKTVNQFIYMDKSIALMILKEVVMGSILNHIFQLRKIACTIRKSIDTEMIAETIKVPTLILWAKDDDVLPVEMGYRLHKRIKGSKFIAVSGRHDWCIFYPDILINHVRNSTNLSNPGM